MILAQELIDWSWVERNQDAILARTGEHLYLTGVSVGLGLVIALALAVASLRWRALYQPVTWTAGLLYTIPSLAFFALLVPVLGIGAANAIAALTSYTLLILVRNVVAGIDGVPQEVREAADGMGLTRRQRLWKMEIPLALPVIVAGVRIASVTTVGLVTVSAMLGLGGYGFFILRGLQTFFWTQIIVGVTLSVVLATILDGIFVALQTVLSPWAKRRAV